MSVHFLEVKKADRGSKFVLETDGETRFPVIEGKTVEIVIEKLGKAFSSAIGDGKLEETDVLNVRTPDGKVTELGCSIN